MNVFIIAEIGINHNGNINLAKQMILSAKEAGVNCVKFQTFKAEEFVSDSKQMYTYKSQGKEVTESMLEMFKRFEFTVEEWKEIIEFCEKNNMVFSSTAQNISDLDFLLSITNLPFIKVGSDDLTNIQLMKYYASKQLPMIISAGMAYYYEIEDAIMAIRSEGNNDITVLHCVSSYPTASEEVNLKKIPIIKDVFGVKVGFSDHTIGSSAAVGSVCFGATVIEKHFTLDNDLEGPDHWFSINSRELKSYVNDIRFIEKAIGKPNLEPTLKEIEMRKIARRKIVAKKFIKVGEKITTDSISFKRVNDTSSSLDPKYLEFILNRKVNKDIRVGEVIKLDFLS